MAPYITAIGFGFLALAHSFLGERELLRPLFAAKWELPIPRWAAQRVFRFAWHLTSLAWIGLAALALGASVWTILAAVALASGAVIFFALRGHLAWPLFFVAAGAAGLAGDFIGSGMLAALSASTIATLVVLGFVHLYWVAGGRSGLDAVVPTTTEDRAVFTPPVWATLAVAVALFGTAGLLGLGLAEVAMPGRDALTIVAAVVLGARALGDGRYVGFSKREHETRFGRMDDQLYTPLSVLMCLGCVATLLH